jgi:hypothetical protein
MRLPYAEAFVIDRKLRDTSNKPITPDSVRETAQFLSKIQNANIAAAPATVQTLGHRFLRAAKDKPEAWQAVLSFANYKSFLNATLTFQYRDIGQPGETLHTDYSFRTPPGVPAARLAIFGAVPYSEAAILHEIGAFDPNEEKGRGNDWIMAQDGGFVLDGLQMKKVICVNCLISYSGGPVEMQSVSFLGCTFSVKHEPNGEKLISAILNPSPRTDFTAL